MSRRSSGGASPWLRFVHDKPALWGASILALLLSISAAGPLLGFPDPLEQSDALLLGPHSDHLLGTDELGRDVGSRLVSGTQVTLVVAFSSALTAMTIGVPIGIVAGYMGAWFESVPMRVMDLLLAVPNLLVALVVVTVLGASTLNLILAIGFVGVPIFARLARASTLSIRELDYVTASRAMGATDSDTMTRTILPNILGPIIVQFVITASSAVVVAASLNFLGLGAAPPAPSWGGMLYTAKSHLFENPWYGIFPGVALALTIACLDRVGYGLQRAFGTSNEMSKASRMM